MGWMPYDLFQVLTRFHREVITPDLDRRDERLGAVEQKLDGVLTHFGSIFHRFERLETEYQALLSAARRIENQVDVLARTEVRWEIERDPSSRRSTSRTNRPTRVDAVTPAFRRPANRVRNLSLLIPAVVYSSRFRRPVPQPSPRRKISEQSSASSTLSSGTRE
jgi:hypothetical protein